MKIITLFTLCALSVLNAYSAESQDSRLAIMKEQMIRERMSTMLRP